MVASPLTRKNLIQALNLFLALTSSFMVYKFLGLIANVESPIVVVLSGSMEPAFARGDIIFLTNPNSQPYVTGDILVYNVPNGEGTPIVHRVLETHNAYVPVESSPKTNEDAKRKLPQKMLTKGDNNHDDDTVLYNGIEWLEGHHIVGKVWGFLPYLGYVTILMNDVPSLKYVLLGGLGLFTVIFSE